MVGSQQMMSVLRVGGWIGRGCGNPVGGGLCLCVGHMVCHDWRCQYCESKGLLPGLFD